MAVPTRDPQPPHPRPVRYRGGPGQWAAAAHRVSGTALFVYVLLLVVERSTLLLGPTFHDRFRDVLDTAPFHVVEVALIAAVLWHALNGLRLIALDVVPRLTEHHDRLVSIQAGTFLALWIPAAWIVLERFFEVAG